MDKWIGNLWKRFLSAIARAWLTSFLNWFSPDGSEPPGEGDLSLEYWRDEHIRFFTKLGCYAPDMMLWCELIERI